MVLKSRISSQRLYSWDIWLKATSLPFKHPTFSFATNYSLRCKLTCTCAADTRAESQSGKNVYTSCGLMPASKTISLKQSRWGGCEQAVWWGPSIQVLGQGLDCVSPLLSHPFSTDPQTDHTHFQFQFFTETSSHYTEGPALASALSKCCSLTLSMSDLIHSLTQQAQWQIPS